MYGITSGGIHNPISRYDDAYIRGRSRMLIYAIDARRQRFPNDISFEYLPMVDAIDECRWTSAARADV